MALFPQTGEQLEGLLDLPFHISLILAIHPRRRLEVVLDRHRWEDRPPPRHQDDTLGGDAMGRDVSDVFAVKEYGSIGRLVKPGDRPQKCGLTRAVGAKESND